MHTNISEVQKNWISDNQKYLRIKNYNEIRSSSGWYQTDLLKWLLITIELNQKEFGDFHFFLYQNFSPGISNQQAD